MAFKTAKNENKEAIRKSMGKDSDDDETKDVKTSETKEKSSENKTEVQRSVVDPITKKVNEIDIKIINEENVEVRVKSGEGTSRETESEENQKKRRSSELHAASSEREKSVSPNKKSNKSPTKERKVGVRKSPRLKEKANRLSPGSKRATDKSSDSESDGSPKKETKDKTEKEVKSQPDQEKGASEGSQKKDETVEGAEGIKTERDKNPILRSLLIKPPLAHSEDMGDFYKSEDK